MYGWCPWGVQEVPSGIAGTTYTKSNLGSTKNPYFEKLALFPPCMWKWGESAPFCQARLSRQNRPQCAKTHDIWQSLSSRTEKLRTFSKNILFWDRFSISGDFFAVFALLNIFRSWHTLLTVPAAPGRLNPTWVLQETLVLKNWLIYGIYGGN